MKWPLWKDVLIPTLLLGGLWLAFSSATSVYIAWLDRGYQEVLETNISSMRAAGDMQDSLWRLHQVVAQIASHGASSEMTARIDADTGSFREALDSAEAVALTADEQEDVQYLRKRFDDLTRVLQDVRQSPTAILVDSTLRDQSRALAAELSARCSHLREVNQSLIDAYTERLHTWSTRVLWLRGIIVLLGPIMGVWLGFRVAWRLQRRLAEIRVRLEGASGELGTLQVSSHSTPGNLDELDRQVAVVTDRLAEVVKNLQTARNEVLRSERLAAVGQLAAGVAHELRNPLTAVKLLLQTIGRKLPSGSLTEKKMGVVQDEIARMERTIQSLLDFARPPIQHRVRHDLRETLGRAMNLVEGRAVRDRVLIEPQMPNEPAEVDGDPEQLHQVFVNLLLNSMDAMPDGGPLTVILRIEAPAFRAAGTKPLCEVTVTDSGSGISAPVIEHIFEPFMTTKQRGTGLGLAVSHRIIEEHGGTLTAANAPTGGAVFSVKLPIVTRLEHIASTAPNVVET
jgi:signal transduction histidine kinase